MDNSVETNESRRWEFIYSVIRWSEKLEQPRGVNERPAETAKYTRRGGDITVDAFQRDRGSSAARRVNRCTRASLEPSQLRENLANSFSRTNVEESTFFSICLCDNWIAEIGRSFEPP